MTQTSYASDSDTEHGTHQEDLTASAGPNENLRQRDDLGKDLQRQLDLVLEGKHMLRPDDHRQCEDLRGENLRKRNDLCEDLQRLLGLVRKAAPSAA